MLRYMLDTNICIYVIKNRPAQLRQRFNQLADQLCVSVITLAELIYGAEKSARVQQNLEVVEQFRGRLEVLSIHGTRRQPLWSALGGARSCGATHRHP